MSRHADGKRDLDRKWGDSDAGRKTNLLRAGSSVRCILEEQRSTQIVAKRMRVNIFPIFSFIGFKLMQNCSEWSVKADRRKF